MKSPILFLIFNRPEMTREVFGRIREARPARLYIAADGPRAAVDGEGDLCRATRAMVADVDWPCDVQTLLRDENLGCRYAVSQAIDWFFDQEPEGIILEDDCLPDPSFFRYCDALLAYYRDDERVMAINGANKLAPSDRASSYFFSRHFYAWGWATWRRAWRHYDVEMRSWPSFRDKGGLTAWSSGERGFERYWEMIYDMTYRGFDTWDYQWMYACWSHGGLICRPYANLVSNLGFGAEATHTINPAHPDARARSYAIDLPLRHPTMVVRDLVADRAAQGRVWRPLPKWWEIRRRAARSLDRYMKNHPRIHRHTYGIRKLLGLVESGFGR